MSEQACPRCKTTKYRNPALKLMVNVCGHTLCENCVELLFIRGSGACLECGTALRRTNFRLQLFEDAFVEKEVDIRRRILKDFNKKEEDFDSLRDYNDYLEMVESLIFNLATDQDVEETKRQIELYKRENVESIKKNRSKLSRDAEFLEEMIEAERAEAAYHKEQVLQQEKEEKKEKMRNKEALIDELMFSDMSADQILAMHQRELAAKQELKAAIPRERQTAFSTGIKMGKQENVFLPVPRVEEAMLYAYHAPTYECHGPLPPNTPALRQDRYHQAIRPASPTELGGGYTVELALKRALQDAYAGLFFSFEATHTHSGDESMECS